MWFGTDNSITSFNGYEFENYFHNDILFNSPIVAIGERGGVLVFRNERNEYYEITKGGEVKKLSIDEINIPKKELIAIDDDNIKGTYKDKDITAAFLDNNKGIWVSTIGEGIYYTPYHKYIRTISSDRKLYGLTILNDSLIYGYKNDLSLKSQPFVSWEKVLTFDEDKLYYKGDLVYADLGELINPSQKLKLRGVKRYKEHIFFIGDSNVIYKVNLKQKSYITIELPDSFKARIIGFDAFGQLYVGGNHGLLKFHDSRYENHEFLKSFTNHVVVALNHSENYELIVATRGGGLFLREQNHDFVKSELNRVERLYINDLAVDDNGAIWLATNSGIIKFAGDSNNAIYFNDKNGLLSNEVIGVKVKEKKVYAIHHKGISIIDTDSFVRNESLMKVIVPYVRLDNERINLPEEKIIIGPEYSYLTINFLAINYKLEGAINYQYKISGIHNDWVTTKDRKVQFTSLPPKGTYLFEVKAQNEDGVWGEVTTLEMEFLVPFYKSWWFILLLVLVGGVLTWAITRGLYKRKLHVQQLQTERLGFESKALQSQMNPHFVFNALNSIQSFITTGDIMNSEIYLAKFSGLLRKTLNYSSQSVISLSKEIENLETYLELEKLRFGSRLTYSIIVDDSVESDLIEIPPMLMQPFVENAIIHGLSPKPGGGEVQVIIRLKDIDHLVCDVIDNGIGRGTKVTSGHKSLGTGIVKKRLALISSATNDMVVYTDLKDDEGKAIGTKVRLIIPIKC